MQQRTRIGWVGFVQCTMSLLLLKFLFLSPWVFSWFYYLNQAASWCFMGLYWSCIATLVVDNYLTCYIALIHVKVAHNFPFEFNVFHGFSLWKFGCFCYEFHVMSWLSCLVLLSCFWFKVMNDDLIKNGHGFLFLNFDVFAYGFHDFSPFDSWWFQGTWCKDGERKLG